MIVEDIDGLGYYAICPECRAVLCEAPMGIKLGRMCCMVCKLEMEGIGWTGRE